MRKMADTGASKGVESPSRTELFPARSVIYSGLLAPELADVWCRCGFPHVIAMYTTHLSLMERVRNNRDEVAWQEFYDVYKSLIYRYALQRDLSDADAEEIVGQCFAKLSSEMSQFEFRPTRGKFKTWLKQLVNNKITNLLAKRPREGLVPNSDLDARTAVAPDALWDRTWKQEVLNYCVQQARAKVSTRNYQIFRLSVYEGWAAGQIGESLGLKPEQVHRAKQRVLRIVREEMTKYLEA